MPAVPTAFLQPEALKARFEQPPAWQPEVVRESFTSERPPAQAAVLVPIVMRGPQASSPTVLLTRRAAYDAQARNYRTIATDIGAKPDLLVEDPTLWRGRIKSGTSTKAGAARPALSDIFENK